MAGAADTVARSEPLEAGSDLRFDGPERQVQFGGHFLVGPVLEKGQAHCPSLRGRERFHRGEHGCPLFFSCDDLVGVRGGVRQVRHPQIHRTVHQLRPPAAPPKFVEDPVVRDLKHPRAEPAPRWVERAGLAPDREEDFLDDLLGGGPIKDLSGETEDPGGVAVVEGLERLLPAAGHFVHQCLIGGIAVRRRGRR
jgi:hypothetical protein